MWFCYFPFVLPFCSVLEFAPVPTSPTPSVALLHNLQGAPGFGDGAPAPRCTALNLKCNFLVCTTHHAEIYVHAPFFTRGQPARRAPGHDTRAHAAPVAARARAAAKTLDSRANSSPPPHNNINTHSIFSSSAEAL